MQPTTATPKTPVIKCLPRPDFQGGMTFWCPFCGSWHRHGRHEGYRVPHCTNYDSPFRGHDYKIKLMSLAELKEIREAINDWLRLAPEKRKAYQK